MRARALFSLVGALVVAVALVSASGAATTKAQRTTKINVSTRAAVVHYLRSIHVNPKGAVIQRGLRNYAGASCPGKGWKCASTRQTVVQIARPGGQNRFVCRSKRCVVVQISGVSHGVYSSGRQLAAKGGGGNSGSCVKTGSGATSGTGQSCTIKQSGTGSNMAAVYQNSMKVSGLMAAAAYTASITQQVTGGDQGNKACVLQSINLDGSTTGLKGKPVTVTLDGNQSVTINQDVAGGGTNYANQAAKLDSGGTTASCDDSSSSIAQSQVLTSTANGTASITQNENSQQIACGDGVGTVANLCLDIEQNMVGGNGVASGLNYANFTQSSDLEAVANTPAGAVFQTQGFDNPAAGGLVGTINQYSSQVSTATATQNEIQCEDAAKSGLGSASSGGCHINDGDAAEAPASLTQHQYGPEGMGYRPTKQHRRILYTKVTKGLGVATQTGNPGDKYTIIQHSTQNNDQGGGSTQTNTVHGDCTSAGNCTGSSAVHNNGGTTNNGNSGGGGGTVTYDTNCTANCAATANFPGGNVFVSVGNGQVQEWNPNASPAALVRTFDTGEGAVYTTGLAFDASKNLYVTDFNANAVTKFKNDGSLDGPFGSGYSASPESIVFDSSGNAYVGQADGSHQVLKFDPSGAPGTPIAAFSPSVESRGTDWIDLASDGCTLYYTSEGTTVKTFNVCTNTQGTDFATGLPGPGEAFAIKLLPGGGALVADTDSIVRLDGSGNVVHQYGTGESTAGGWFSLALDPSGSSFWAGDLFTGDVKKFDLATGTVLASFNTGSTVVGGEAAGLAISP